MLFLLHWDGKRVWYHFIRNVLFHAHGELHTVQCTQEQHRVINSMLLQAAQKNTSPYMWTLHGARKYTWINRKVYTER